MIVPQTRLLIWFAATAPPAGLLVAVFPEWMGGLALLMAALAVIAVADGLKALRSLDGFAVELPEVARLARGRAGHLLLRVRNPFPNSRRVRLALPFPDGIETDTEALVLALPAGTEWSLADWPCRPRRRGRFRIESAHLEGASHLGLWAVRARLPARCELRVYPNLLTERRGLAGLFLHKGVFGVHARRQVGKGREFEKLREYVPGDSFEDVHWKATARRGHPITKVFQIEKTQEVYVVVDASRLSARNAASHSEFQVLSPPGNFGMVGTELETPGSKLASGESNSLLDRFLAASLILGLAAEQQGDLFGVVTFSAGVDRFLRARNGKAHYGACRDALYTLEPHLVAPDFDEIATFLRLRLRRRALLVFLTSLDDPVLAENFTHHVDLLCRQHLVLVNMLPPPSTTPLFTRDDVRSADDLYRVIGGHLQWRRLRELGKVLERRGVRFSLLDPERLSAQLVGLYLEVKQRQML